MPSFLSNFGFFLTYSVQPENIFYHNHLATQVEFFSLSYKKTEDSAEVSFKTSALGWILHLHIYKSISAKLDSYHNFKTVVMKSQFVKICNLITYNAQNEKVVFHPKNFVYLRKTKVLNLKNVSKSLNNYYFCNWKVLYNIQFHFERKKIK